MNYIIPLVKESFYKEKATKRKLINFIKNCEKFSMGEQTKQFEKKFAEFQNTKHCVYFSSGSAANLGLIQSLKNIGHLKNGDKVAISSLTWATNVMPVIQLGLIPVPIDIDIETLNISLEDLYSKYEAVGFKCIFLTNVLSLSCDMKKLNDFCDKNSILLIEDNCESMGSEFEGQKLGNFGKAGTMSFFVGHQMSTIEGGCVVTEDEDLYEMLKKVRAHGWSRDNKDFSNTHFYSRFTFHDLAYNLRPGEINAFIGLYQLDLIDQNLNRRRLLHKKFQKQLKNKNSVYPLKILNNNYAPFAFTLIFKEKEKADHYLNLFHENGVEVRPVISGNITKQPFFQKYHPENYLLPNCEIVHNQGFYFGINPNLSKNEIEILIKLLSQIE
jgi:CDP-4-dehydro-6-deoxyglucose reductase, E1